MGDIAEQVECMVFLCLVWIAMGKRDGAEKLAAEAVALAERADLPLSIALAYLVRGNIYFSRGAVDEAVALWGRAAEQYERVGARPQLSASLRAGIRTFAVDSATRKLLGGLASLATDMAFPRSTPP